MQNTSEIASSNPSQTISDNICAPAIEDFTFDEQQTISPSSNIFLCRGQDGEQYVAKVFDEDIIRPSFDNEVEFLNFFRKDREVVDIVSYDNKKKIIITKYCKYGDLDKFINDLGEISSTLFFKILSELVKAVKLLHANKICHGEINPRNFLVREYNAETEDIQIVIGGFWLAKDIVNPKTIHKQVGINRGYPAPEAEAFNFKAMSLASDIFSLGRVFEFVYKFAKKEIPHNIANLIQKMTMQNPEERLTIMEVESILSPYITN